jgi:hypothetical protein
MKTRPFTLLNIALTAILLTSLLLVGAIPSSSMDEYDPWCDYDDDGDIDIYDIVNIANRYGTAGTPLNKTALLLELQSRVETLEARMGQSKTIRFFEPNETFTDGPDTVAATFVWTPVNSSNNAILGGVVYFEWMAFLHEGHTYASLGFGLNVNGFELRGWGNRIQWGNQPNYIWIPELPIEISWEANFVRYGLTPNQPSYTLTFHVGTGGADMYVRNINLILFVIDGLPAST